MCHLLPSCTFLVKSVVKLKLIVLCHVTVAAQVRGRGYLQMCSRFSCSSRCSGYVLMLSPSCSRQSEKPLKTESQREVPPTVISSETGGEGGVNWCSGPAHRRHKGEAIAAASLIGWKLKVTHRTGLFSADRPTS